jgi:transcriptional regulator with XRE-family HTH domain
MALTNREIGEMIGLTHSAVSRLLSGARVPSVETMKSIARVFEVELQDVVNAASTGKTAEDRANHWGTYFTTLVKSHQENQGNGADQVDATV